MLKDPLLRLVLTRREKWDGLIVGTLFFGGITLCLTGAFTGWAGFLEMGICFVAGCIPSAMIFPNYSRNGQFLFGGITIFAIISGIVNLVIIQQTGNPDAYPAGPMFFLTITAAALTTWISGIPSLRRNYSID